jgi:hypothetical protein
MTGYLPVGFEFAAEITYPEPEGMKLHSTVLSNFLDFLDSFSYLFDREIPWNFMTRRIKMWSIIFRLLRSRYSFIQVNILQCCGTVMICCGSGSFSDIGKVLVPIPAPAPESDQDNIYCSTVFQKQKYYKFLPFNVRSSLFPRKLASHFWFFYFFVTFYAGSGSKSCFRIGSGAVMSSGSGSAEAKSYGSCDSGSGAGSTILLLGTSSGLLNASAQIFGIICTLFGEWLYR